MKLLLNAALLAALTLTFLLGACGGGARESSGLKGQPAAEARPDSPALSLPAPSLLAGTARISSAADPLLRYGGEFDPALPNQSVSASGLAGIYSGSAAKLSDSAYALYSFDTQDYSGTPVFSCSWGKLPAGPAYAWIGVANFASDRWEWSNASAGVGVHLANMADYVSPAGESLVAIVLAAQDSAELATVQLGSDGGFDEIEDNDSFEQIKQTLTLGDTLFAGHIGQQPYVNGPDGDSNDYYEIDAEVGDWVTVVCYTDNPSLFIGMALTTAKGELIGLPAYTGGYSYAAVGRQPIQNADDLPLRLQVTSNGSVEGARYFLRVYHDSQFNSGDQLLPSLKADVYSGAAPLTVNFDGSASYDSGGDAITNFWWDWDGDLVFDEDSGTDSTVSHTFTEPGVYRVHLKLVDAVGDIGIGLAQNFFPRGNLTITVGDIPYDERENNDDYYTELEYNQLPALPFNGYRGNVGPAPATLGYDGDSQDQYRFSAVAGEKWTFISDFDPAPEGLEYSPALQVTRTNFGNLGLHFSTTRCYVGVLFDETTDYYLRVTSPVLRDYQLQAIPGLPPQAVTLNLDSPDRGAIPFTVDFSATATDGHGALSKFEWDFDGDGTWDSDTGASASTSHTYTQAGIFKPRVRITDAGGFSGESDGMSTVYAWPIAYDEIESNDNTPQSLSVFPLVDFKGNVGTAGSNDGSSFDNYILDGFTAGQSVQATIDLAGPDGAKAYCILYNGAGNVLVEGGPGASKVLRYSIKPTDALPIKLRVQLYEVDEDSNVVPLNSDYTLNIAAPSDTPIPAISAPVLSGDVPLTVDFDASASTDGDGIAKYEFDLNCDNVWTDNGADSTLSHTYTEAGSYVVRVRVTDSLGNVSNALSFVHVIAGSGFYDEVENNDDWMNPPALPAFPISDFRGSIGSAAGYTSTDGDNDDFFGFSGTAGQTLTIDLRCNGAFANSLLWLYSSTSGYVASLAPSEDAGATAQMLEVLPETGNYYIWVQAFAPGFGDYSFDATLE
ncbi:PKD domain-containing protein [bacterium]|nr:PKD domain-containing protein [bacterium]